jgi:putative endonuclease
MTARQTGDRAEAEAARFLQSRGFFILARNYCIRGAEVDIIAKAGDFIAFVEVKYRKSLRFAAPRESVDLAKQKRISRAALCYLQENGAEGANVRFDIVEITPAGTTLLRGAFGYAE